ncbi:hypothetical protein [Rhodoferax mekongensis]|uniref:hypothetical protein n=1 Tax=Rhodoferax mekongensis TaxID=3068341 RepID=UPI0028BE7C9E|nr:hypothetical protein [Rhodoferax sp. TBRC 17199]MDT7514839.1 hypothetical protein [Rhodoferax sp. TBRC 17199]
MVYLVFTRPGYDELIAQRGTTPSPLWVNVGVLSTTELFTLREAGVEVTNFTRVIDPHNVTEIQEAVFIVQDHHSGQRVWVEYAPDL